LVAAAALACRAPAEEASKMAEVDHAPLPATEVARVQEDTISKVTVERVSRARGSSLGDALSAALEDAWFAAGLRESQPQAAAGFERLARARLALEAIEAESSEQPPTDDELAQASEQYWWDIDRPESFQTAHALVKLEADGDADAAVGVARKLRAKLVAALEPAAFMETAKGFDGGGFDIIAEALPPVARDGRLIPSKAPLPGAPSPGVFEIAYAEAASELEVGTLSEPVRSPFGFHLIWLFAKHPGAVLDEAEKLELLHSRIFEKRGEVALATTLERLRQQHPVVVVDGAVAFTEQLVEKQDPVLR
jgi:hypothetical protein